MFPLLKFVFGLFTEAFCILDHDDDGQALVAVSIVGSEEGTGRDQEDGLVAVKRVAEAASKILAQFVGVRRRFEFVGEVKGCVIIDDYAHHPTEVRAVLQAARQRFDGHSVWVVFQPHTYR